MWPEKLQQEDVRVGEKVGEEIAGEQGEGGEGEKRKEKEDYGEKKEQEKGEEESQSSSPPDNPTKYECL